MLKKSKYIMILAAVLVLMGCAGQAEPEKQPEDLVIHTIERCKVGEIRTETGKELYKGSIRIENDGRNGKPIEIIIEE